MTTNELREKLEHLDPDGNREIHIEIGGQWASIRSISVGIEVEILTLRDE